MPQTKLSWNNLSIDDTQDALKELYHLISIQYYDTWAIDQSKMLHQVLSSFVNSLWDPFSSYLPPEEGKELNDSIWWNETIDGIWAVLSKKDNWALVEEVIKSSPASQSDIRPLDLIIKVNGSGVQQMSIWEIVRLIRWERWSLVKLTIARNWSWNNIDIIEKEVQRDTISIPSVTSKILNINKKILWYITISLFAQNTDEKLIQEIDKLKKENVSWIILDLRGNGWWLLPESVDVASHFLPIGTDIVSVKYRLYSDNTYKAEWNDTLSKLPVVILVDKFTASASEIITLAIKEWRCYNWWENKNIKFTDTCDVVIVWEKTFGKWSIQNLQNLSFWWAIKLTIWKWFSPSWISIDHIGINPDITVVFDNDRYQKNWYDSQLEVAKSIFSQ